MTNREKEVKKILKNAECLECLESVHLWNNSKKCTNCKALKICQLFEPKPDEGRRAIVGMHIEDIIKTAELHHNDKGDSTQTLFKMDIDALQIAHELLLQDSEPQIRAEKDQECRDLRSLEHFNYCKEIEKVRAECQARVGRVFREIEGMVDRETNWIQNLKKREGIK